MGNLINNLKKFFTNKNTVTIVGLIVGVIVLWLFYNYRLNQAISPRRVPVAAKTILATEEIKDEDIEWVEINSSFLNKAKIITNKNQLVGYYVNVGTSIPEGGLFYSSQVVEQKNLPNSIQARIPEGYTLFYFSVNNTTTFGNSMYPGDRIDIYLRTTDEVGRLVYGKFIESIEILDVRDSQNQSVFDSTSTRQPALLLFAVPSNAREDGKKSIYDLLSGARELSGMELVPVPRNKNYTEAQNETKVASEVLRDMVEEKLAYIPDLDNPTVATE